MARAKVFDVNHTSEKRSGGGHCFRVTMRRFTRVSVTHSWGYAVGAPCWSSRVLVWWICVRIRPRKVVYHGRRIRLIQVRTHNRASVHRLIQIAMEVERYKATLYLVLAVCRMSWFTLRINFGQRGNGDRDGKDLCGVCERTGGPIYFGVMFSQLLYCSKTIVLHYYTQIRCKSFNPLFFTTSSYEHPFRSLRTASRLSHTTMNVWMPFPWGRNYN